MTAGVVEARRCFSALSNDLVLNTTVGRIGNTNSQLQISLSILLVYLHVIVHIVHKQLSLSLHLHVVTKHTFYLHC